MISTANINFDTMNSLKTAIAMGGQIGKQVNSCFSPLAKVLYVPTGVLLSGHQRNLY